MDTKIIDTLDKVVGGGKYMRAIVSIKGDKVTVQTHIFTHVKLAGFTGGVLATFSDVKGNILYVTPLVQHGVDGEWIPGKPSDRWISDSFDVDPLVEQNTDRIDVWVGMAPRNRLFEDLGISLEIVGKVVVDIVTWLIEQWLKSDSTASQSPEMAPIQTTVAGLTVVRSNTIDAQYAIESIAFPGVCLRMDGRGVTASTPSGGGIVNCQYTAGAWERFRLAPQGDDIVAVESTAFPGVYLRMDGRGVTAPSAAGGGTVNGQYTAGAWERFRLVPQGSDTVAIESIAFPGVFLRMDGRGVTTSTASGGGAVNCQYTPGAWEKFRLTPLS